MRPLILALIFAVIPAITQAQQTPSLRDVIELSKAGVGDEVLLALIEVHRPVYPVDPDTLKSLKEAGVAPNVIIAMIRSGRQPAAPLVGPAADVPPRPMYEPAPSPQPQVVVIEHEHQAPPAREVVVPVAVPVQYPVYSRWVYPIRQHGPDVDPPKKPRAEPVYWGWGGKLRPDAWKPAEEPPKRKR
jgi:hypothetical protein